MPVTARWRSEARCSQRPPSRWSACSRARRRTPHTRANGARDPTLSQLHSYDWLARNAAFAAVLLATGLEALQNGALPAPLAWLTLVIGASLLTPLGFVGFFLLPLWLIVVGLVLRVRRDRPSTE